MVHGVNSHWAFFPFLNPFGQLFSLVPFERPKYRKWFNIPNLFSAWVVVGGEDSPALTESYPRPTCTA